MSPRTGPGPALCQGSRLSAHPHTACQESCLVSASAGQPQEGLLEGSWLEACTSPRLSMMAEEGCNWEVSVLVFAGENSHSHWFLRDQNPGP
uniref:CDPK2 n=1 Tax=Arundo donax TaxID=35708 RepID=A0A0A9NTC1_ARUDO